MKDINYVRGRLDRLDKRVDLLESFLKWMFQAEHRRPSEELKTRPKKEK